MSLNTSHTPDRKGVLVYNGETILLYAKHVNLSFSSREESEFKGTKKGSLYLTSHRGEVVPHFDYTYKGDLKWKLVFAKGGCINFGEALLYAIRQTGLNEKMQNYTNSSYEDREEDYGYHSVSDNIYLSPNDSYYGFKPPIKDFPEKPPVSDIYQYEKPPPYPGLAPSPR